MEYPENVRQIARKAMLAHGDDIDKAIAVAEKRVRALPDYPEFEAYLLHNAVRDAVYTARSEHNKELNRQAGRGHSKRKVEHCSTEVRRVYRSYYTLCIAGKTLGSILGQDLLDIAKTERATGKGFERRALLCEALAPLVPEGKTVQQAVSEKKLAAIYEGIWGNNKAA